MINVNRIKTGLVSVFIWLFSLSAIGQITAISPNQAYAGDSLTTSITSSALFLTSSSPQGNIQNIILKNASDSAFAVSDSTDVISTSSATTFWRIPSSLATGMYSLVVRIYNNLFSGPTTDYTLSNSFNVTTPVWPGDADNNHVVDNYDLLPIGLGYDTSGHARLSTSIVWQAQSSVDWGYFFSSYSPALNFKYADCNGDGTINALDTAAIAQNFSLTHAKTGGILSLWRSGLPALMPVFSSDTLYNGDTLQVNFVLGTGSIPANNIYGLAFTYNFDPLVIDSNYTSAYFGSSWLGNSNLISFSRVLGTQGQIKVGITRIDHSTISGNGSLGYASFKITTDNISGVIEHKYANAGYISDLVVIDDLGDTIPVNGGTDTITVVAYPNALENIKATAIRVMPDPASTMINISAGDVIREVRITGIDGQQLWRSTQVRSSSLNVDVSGYDDGLYLVQVKTTKGEQVVKLLITR